MKILKFLSAAIVALLLTACANKEADLAFEAANSGMGTEEVLEHAEAAFDDLDDMSMEDACKLTVAYHYLYLHTMSTNHGAKFRKCYEKTQEFGHTDAADCFNELTGEEKTAKLMKYTYKGSDLLNSASDIAGDAINELLNNL